MGYYEHRIYSFWLLFFLSQYLLIETSLPVSMMGAEKSIGEGRRMKQKHVSTNSSEPGLSSRRHFLATMGKGAALASLGIFGAGSGAALKGLFGRGLIPAAWGAIEQNLLPKPDMLVHSEQPFNGEFAPHLLNDNVTPIARHFVRNNSSIPERAKSGDLNGWQLTIDGEVHKKLSLSMDDLIRFPQVTMQVVVECAGNGRSLFTPKVDGTPWIRGAVGCSEWTGVRLRDVLKAAGLKETAVYTGNYGADLPIGSGSTIFTRDPD